MSETTANDFIAQLREARLVPETSVDELAAKGPFENDKQAAKRAIEQGLVTLWQAKRLLSGNTDFHVGPYVLADRLPAPSGCNLFRAIHAESNLVVWLEWEPQAQTPAEAIDAAMSAAADCFVAPTEVLTLGEGQALIYAAVDGKTYVNDKNKAVRLERVALGKAIRTVAEGFNSLHSQDQAWGRLHPAQLIETNQGLRLGRWGSWPGQTVQNDPLYAAEYSGQKETASQGDLVALGRIAMLLGYGTLTASKVNPKSRLDRLVLQIADPSEKDAPQTAAELMAAVDEWLASKGEETVSTESPEAADEATSVTLPSIETDDQKVTSAAIPSIDTQEVAVAKVNPKGLQIHNPEFRQRSMIVTYIVYGTLTLMILVGTVIALIFVNTAQQKPEVAKAETTEQVQEVVNELEGQIDEENQAPGPVTDEEPAPLIELDLPGDNGVNVEPPVLPLDPLNENDNTNVVVDPPVEPQAPVDPMPNPEMENDPDTVANNDNNNEPPVVAPDPPTPDPVEPEKPYVPAFKDLPKAVTLPEVGEGDWKNEVVLGTIHLQSGDLLFTELKGEDKAFRENTTFEISNADGGTAQYAFDIVAVVGGQRSRIAKLDAEGGTLKFRYYDEAEETPSANYLRNCYLRLRTGTDVGGMALRTPVKLSPLKLAEKSIDATSDTVLGYLPDTSAIKAKVLPLSENFPDYAFSDNKSVVSATRGKVDIIFGGKYKEAMFLQLESQLRNKLTLSVKAYSLINAKPRPFKADELAKGLEQAKQGIAQIEATIKQMDMVPREQRARNFDAVRQATESQRKQTAAAIKQAEDTLNFVAGMKGQELPVGVYFEAEEFKVYLATPSGDPLDD